MGKAKSLHADASRTAGPSNSTDRVSTGIRGLDDILGGGLTAQRVYLLEGNPGTGKTTLALQFLLQGVAKSEKALYITLSETAAELHAIAATHFWNLDEIKICELISQESLQPDSEQSILHSSELELGETMQRIITLIDTLRPKRVVFDSLSEMRLLANNALRYRRQILALKHFLATRRCTVLLLDDRTSDPSDLQVHSIAHGVITLDQQPQEFGADRRRLHVVKMRGIKFRGGWHDVRLDTGGLQVYPRLVAAEHQREFKMELRSTGSPQLDALLGGGLAKGSNILLTGPSGVGKTTTAVRCMLAALQRGERCAHFLFDEGLTILLARSTALGMDIRPYLDNGQLRIVQVDPAELAPGEFSSKVRAAVEEGASVVVIDSLNAYLQAMPGERFLMLHMHELLNYLNQQGVTTLVCLAQHGVVGQMRADLDLSYLSDSLLLFRFFEAKGEILSAVSVLKSRTNDHERSIREFRLSPRGLVVGDTLRDFEGIMSGLPSYCGATPMLSSIE